jgi:hypothetical protein
MIAILRSPLGRGALRQEPVKCFLVKRLPPAAIGPPACRLHIGSILPHLKRSVPDDLKYGLPLWLPADQDGGIDPSWMKAR